MEYIYICVYLYIYKQKYKKIPCYQIPASWACSQCSCAWWWPQSPVRCHPAPSWVSFERAEVPACYQLITFFKFYVDSHVLPARKKMYIYIYIYHMCVEITRNRISQLKTWHLGCCRSVRIGVWTGLPNQEFINTLISYEIRSFEPSPPLIKWENIWKHMKICEIIQTYIKNTRKCMEHA